MKKKLLFLVLCITFSLTGLVGCGQDEVTYGTLNIPGAPDEDLEAQAELEAQELAAKEEAERLAEEEAKRNAYLLATPTVDIQTSSVSTPIVQIGNAVVKTSAGVTLRSVYDTLVNDSGIEGLKLLHNGNEVSSATLLNPWTGNSFETFSIVDDKNSEVCTVQSANVSGDIQAALDSVVVSIGAPSGKSPHILNFFYPGNICAGSFSVDQSVREMDNYKIRMKTYPVFDYMSLPLYVKGTGADYTYENGKLEYQTLTHSPVFLLNGAEYYRLTTYSYSVDLSSSIVTSLNVTHSVKEGSEKAFSVNDIGKIENLPLDEIEKVCKEALSQDTTEEYAQDTKIVGYYVTNKSYIVLQCGENEDGESLFVTVELKVDENYNGFNVYSVPYVWSGSKNTLEKMCKYQGISVESITFTDESAIPVPEEEAEVEEQAVSEEDVSK